MLRKLIKDRKGATTLEYGLLLLAVLGVGVLITTQLQKKMVKKFEEIGNGIDEVNIQLVGSPCTTDENTDGTIQPDGTCA